MCIIHTCCPKPTWRASHIDVGLRGCVNKTKTNSLSEMFTDLNKHNGKYFKDKNASTYQFPSLEVSPLGLQWLQQLFPAPQKKSSNYLNKRLCACHSQPTEIRWCSQAEFHVLLSPTWWVSQQEFWTKASKHRAQLMYSSYQSHLPACEQ